MKAKIKTWSKMEEEYGLTDIGYIDVPYGFTKDIEKYIPKDRVVEIDKIDKNGFVLAKIPGFTFPVSREVIEEIIYEDHENEIYDLLAEAGLGDIARVGFGKIKFGKRILTKKEAIFMAERLSEAMMDLLSAIRKDEENTQ